MDDLTETHRRTPPTFHHIGLQSPRVGGCVSTFFHMIDWKHSKRLSSSRRITADRPKKEALYAKREKFVTECTIVPTLKLSTRSTERDEVFATPTNTLAFNSTPNPGSANSDGTSERVPGVVARLMGLESLPDKTYPPSRPDALEFCCNMTGDTAREHVDFPPILLHELLGQKFHQCSKKPLKLMSISKKSKATRSERPFENRTSSTRDAFEPSMKQPFLARLQHSAPNLHHSKPVSSPSSSLLSPSMLSGYTVKLLKSTVKDREPSKQPSPGSKNTMSREAHRDTQSAIGGSFRSETRSICSSKSRRESSANSSSRSFRTPSISRTWSERDDRPKHSGYESYSSGSQSFRTRYDPGRQDQASRRACEMASPRSSSSLKTHGTRIPVLKKAEAGSPSPRAVLGTHEASIRGFKTDLGISVSSPREKNLENQRNDSQAEDFGALPWRLAPTTPIHVDATTEEEPPLRCNYDQNADFSQGSIIMSKTLYEKSVTGGGFRSIHFRNKGAKHDKNHGSQGNRVLPSDKQPVEHSVGLSLAKEENVTGVRSSYGVLFSNKKQANKKECFDKSGVPKMNHTDSTSMLSLLKRPRSTPGPSSMPTTQLGSQNVKTMSKSGKKVTSKVGLGKLEVMKGVAKQGSSLVEISIKEPLSPIRKQFEKTRYKSIDDVFPELPLEENGVGWASPDLRKTIQAVEDKFLGIGLHGETATQDCRSIERMFGKGISGKYVPVSPTSSESSLLENATSKTSPHVLPTKCRSVTATVPNSALVKYEEKYFLSRNLLMLQDMFVVAHGDQSNDLCGPLRSFRSLEDREIVLDDDEAGADVDACSNSASCDTGGTPERLEIQIMPVAAGWSEDVATPPALKKFEEKLALGFCDSDEGHTLSAEECEQPSPVSVLVSPFLDEVAMTPATSFTGSQQTKKNLTGIGDMSFSPSEEDEEQTHPIKDNVIISKASEMATQDTIEVDQIKQGNLSILRFPNLNLSSIEPPITAPIEPHQELSYIRDVLDAINPLRGLESGRCPSNSPMKLPLCDGLESGNIVLDEFSFESERWCTLLDAPSQSSRMNPDRKLLFDCIHEVIDLEPWMKTSSFYVDLPMFPEMTSNSKFRSPIVGEPLVKGVHRMICHWRDIAGNVLDDLIDYDMNVPEGRWLVFSQEVAEVGLDIERMLLKKFLGEIIDELASISTARALMISYDCNGNSFEFLHETKNLELLDHEFIVGGPFTATLAISLNITNASAALLRQRKCVHSLTSGVRSL
ncbi:uncharacterized protein [Physcomitrium patens]|uniref:DUF4378 domain-containing protein n=1 Tax=Physcomitrium patens TaxID=3218 RepID=A0A2K1IHW4_PHYPA|nr:uncharacterized protein LOC112275661 [Physcomitrium patens]PNR28864.1 hypothetical protein PHYPA_027556 [Physcomitrium patens]|eukprot:XP_024361976.1 uncharacterized protein LOC112275661 [Physcomitrella patens]